MLHFNNHKILCRPETSPGSSPLSEGNASNPVTVTETESQTNNQVLHSLSIPFNNVSDAPLGQPPTSAISAGGKHPLANRASHQISIQLRRHLMSALLILLSNSTEYMKFLPDWELDSGTGNSAGHHACPQINVESSARKQIYAREYGTKADP